MWSCRPSRSMVRSVVAVSASWDSPAVRAAEPKPPMPRLPSVDYSHLRTNPTAHRLDGLPRRAPLLPGRARFVARRAVAAAPRLAAWARRPWERPRAAVAASPAPHRPAALAVLRPSGGSAARPRAMLERRAWLLQHSRWLPSPCRLIRPRVTFAAAIAGRQALCRHFRRWRRAFPCPP